MWGRAVAALAACAAAGCVAPGLPPPATTASLPETPEGVGSPRCKVAASQASPLVTEWPASEKANLEARLSEGGVAVQYTGCEMKILTDCSLSGHYDWQRTTVATDRLEIDTIDELYARLPLGAVSLEGELSRSGQLAVETTVAGRKRLSGLTPASVPDTGGCREATHIVSALAIGAFNLKAGGKASAEATVDMKIVEDTGGKSSNEKSLLRTAGDPERCYDSSDQAPHHDCASPIQMFLTPLPGRAGKQGPEGTVRVDFLSDKGNKRYEIIANDKTICKTPCTKWLHPSTALVMLDRRKWARDVDYQVPDLMRYKDRAPLSVRIRPTQSGKLALGVVTISLSGLAVLTGTSLTAIGCSRRDERGGLCTAGLITLPAGLLGLVPGILWTLQAMPESVVLPAGATTWE